VRWGLWVLEGRGVGCSWWGGGIRWGLGSFCWPQPKGNVTSVTSGLGVLDLLLRVLETGCTQPHCAGSCPSIQNHPHPHPPPRSRPPAPNHHPHAPPQGSARARSHLRPAGGSPRQPGGHAAGGGGHGLLHGLTAGEAPGGLHVWGLSLWRRRGWFRPGSAALRPPRVFPTHLTKPPTTNRT